MPYEERFKELSRYVYYIDPKHEKYDSRIQEGKVIEMQELDYKILKVESNTVNGMQAMAVAPVKNNIVDTSEIIIAYAGTNIDDKLDIMTDIQTVILGYKDSLIKKERLGSTTTYVHVPYESQIISAETFAETIKDDYPHATISTTGHSLGEYIALYIASENGWKNVGFNGPDPYNILSEEAKDWIEANPGMLYNYRNKSDLIGNFGGNGTGAEILVDMEMGSSIKDSFAAHTLSAWQFDDTGQLIISDTVANQEARLIRAEKQMYTQLYELSILGKKLQTSGGGLSANEKIFLDNSQALVAIEYASLSMKTGMEYLIKIYKEAITQAEAVWEVGIELAKNVGTTLSYSEILDTLASAGVTKLALVDEPIAYYNKKIDEAIQIGESFDELAIEIKDSIDKLEQTDRDLANQIRMGA